MIQFTRNPKGDVIACNELGKAVKIEKVDLDDLGVDEDQDWFDVCNLRDRLDAIRLLVEDLPDAAAHKEILLRLASGEECEVAEEKGERR